MSNGDGEVASGEAEVQQDLTGGDSNASVRYPITTYVRQHLTRTSKAQGYTTASMSSNDSEASAAPAAVPTSGRRESTRTRKPSSRLLPSPSPPPPRSSSYTSWMKNRESAAAKDVVPSSGTSPRAPVESYPSYKRSTSQADISVQDANDTSVTSNGKRKRRPSTMTKPPSTITESLSSLGGLQSANPAAPKVKTTRKSLTPERTSAGNVQSSKKAKKHFKVKLESGLTRRKDEDLFADAGNLSDLEDQQIASCGDDSVRTQALSSDARLPSSSKRTNPTSASTLEPPPLISRRGGIKTGISIPRSSSGRSLPSAMHSTPPRSELWSHGVANVSMPLLRFKLDSIVHRSAGEEEDESAAEEEEDFHVAMLDAGKYFDTASDVDEDLPAASVKSSPRASRGYEDSEPEDTPATTPQSPQSMCDPTERCSGTVTESEEEAGGRASNEDRSDAKVVRDAVFAHALEPSSTRSYTHAGSLTLSLPFEEMPQVLDDDGAPALRKTPSVAIPATIKIEEHDQDNVAMIVDDDVFAKNGQAVAEELLETSMAGGIDQLHRHAALLLSSPHPMSAFASPTLTSTTITHAKTEPSHLSLPPMAALADPIDDDVVDLSRASVPTDYSSADDHLSEDEHEELAKGVVTCNPENMCLLELEETWEQGEHGVPQRQDTGEAQTVPGPAVTRSTGTEEATKQQPAKRQRSCNTTKAVKTTPEHIPRATRAIKQSQGRTLRSRA